MEETKTNEPKYRISFKETAKGLVYYDFSVRADTIEQLKKDTEEVMKYAESKSTVGDEK